MWLFWSTKFPCAHFGHHSLLFSVPFLVTQVFSPLSVPFLVTQVFMTLCVPFLIIPVCCATQFALSDPLHIWWYAIQVCRAIQCALSDHLCNHLIWHVTQVQCALTGHPNLVCHMQLVFHLMCPFRSAKNINHSVCHYSPNQVCFDIQCALSSHPSLCAIAYALSGKPCLVCH
jgi:hypothetical protein